ncbi:MAG: TIGR03915 family putative DNA repair protein [Clostridium sp.]|uniref:TIGR03915 family putative DNA repair protein n=1 Tax=Clostridium sp. TaxID=1506 RepID=UPI003055E70E
MKEYLYDGSFEGLLTTIFYCYGSKDDTTITRISNYIPSLITDAIEISSEDDKFDRVYSSIRDKLSYNTLRNIYYIYLSDIYNCEDIIFKYIKLCYKHGDSINQAKNNDLIILVDKYCRKVSLEGHRFTGLVRFKEIEPLTFYACIEPDHNILPIISSHFASRFSDQNFIIHDIKREIAIVYNKSESIISSLSKEEGKLLESASCDDNFQDLWKQFYKSVNIKERENPKLRNRMMPSRYWKHLTEIN